MKKIPTLFKKKYDERGRYLGVINEFNDGFDEDYWMKCRATEKMDGSCCAIIDGKLYKRFDAKPGRKIPDGAIPCCEPDPITGHHPHWVEIDHYNPADKWFIDAFKWTYMTMTPKKLEHYKEYYNGTYEAIGKHFNGNPYNMVINAVTRHGEFDIDLKDWSFEGIKEYLKTHEIEGIVFWTVNEKHENVPYAKIKRKDFGLEWPVKK